MANLKDRNTTGATSYKMPGVEGKRGYVIERMRNAMGWKISVDGGGKTPRELGGRFLQLTMAQNAVRSYVARVEAGVIKVELQDEQLKEEIKEHVEAKQKLEDIDAKIEEAEQQKAELEKSTAPEFHDSPEDAEAAKETEE